MVDLIYEPMFPMHSSGAEGLKKFELDATHETPDSIGPRVNQLLDAQGNRGRLIEGFCLRLR